MPEAKLNRVYTSFSQGLQTDNHIFQFPQNQTVAEANFTIENDNSRCRRNGIDYELNYIIRSVTNSYTTTPVITVGYWDYPNNQTDVSLVVIQIGNSLLFYDYKNASISSNVITVHDMSSWAGGSNITTKVQMQEMLGYLYVVNKSFNIRKLEFDATTPAVTVNEAYSLKFRDTIGDLTDTESVTSRPVTLSNAHSYNLQNQGWPSGRITDFFTDTSSYPANTDQMYLGYYTDISSGQRTWDGTECIQYQVSTSHAPKGFKILDFLTRDRTPSQTLTFTDRQSVIAAFSGRLWYAGFTNTLTSGTSTDEVGAMGSTILYSQIIKNGNEHSKCYQEQDPTSEIINDLLDTDGGTITIPEAGVITRMVALHNSLVVFATNGIWTISGASGEYFKATSYQITKLSSKLDILEESMIPAESGLFFMTKDGIYKLMPSDIDPNQLSITNIAANRLRTYLHTVNFENEVAPAAYNSYRKQVHWLINSPDYTSWEEIIYDVERDLFTRNANTYYSDTDSPRIRGLVSAKTGFKDAEYLCGDQETRYLIINSYGTTTVGVTFACKNNQDYRDFAIWGNAYTTTDGIDALAYLRGGYDFGDNYVSTKIVPNVISYVIRTETDYDVDMTLENQSSCLLRTYWDFRNYAYDDPNTTEQELYRLVDTIVLPPSSSFEDIFQKDIVINKTSIRGEGRVLQLDIRTSPYKDCCFYGLALEYNARQKS